MAMTRPDYFIVAASLNRSMERWKSTAHATVEQVILDLANTLEDHYPNFNRGTFYDACGVPQHSRIRQQ